MRVIGRRETIILFMIRLLLIETWMCTAEYIISRWLCKPSREFGTYRLCEKQRFRRACASVQSRQNLRYSLIQAVSQEEPWDRKPDPWTLWMAGHAQLKFVMTECSKTQIRLTRHIWLMRYKRQPQPHSVWDIPGEWLSFERVTSNNSDSDMQVVLCCDIGMMAFTYEPRHEETCLREFPTRSGSNWPAQLQKLAWGLKCLLQKLETLHYLGSEQ